MAIVVGQIIKIGALISFMFSLIFRHYGGKGKCNTIPGMSKECCERVKRLNVLRPLYMDKLFPFFYLVAWIATLISTAFTCPCSSGSKWTIWLLNIPIIIWAIIGIIFILQFFEWPSWIDKLRFTWWNPSMSLLAFIFLLCYISLFISTIVTCAC